MQVADIRHSLDDRLPVEGEDEPQGGVRGGMLGAEVQGVEELLVGPGLVPGDQLFKWHRVVTPGRSVPVNQRCGQSPYLRNA
jgi:hypothetical protein